MRSPSARCLSNTVALYNYAPTQDEDGGAVFNLTTARIIESNARCSVQLDNASTDYGEGQDRVAQVNTYTIIFAKDYGLNVNDVVVWVDGASTHTMYVNGQINMAGRSAAWAVKAREKI